MRVFAIALLWFSPVCFAATSGQRIQLQSYYGLQNQGEVQVREGELRGERLDLVNDLGLTSVTGLGLSYAFRLANTWVDLGFDQYLVRGKGHLSNQVHFNGATYAPGDVDIRKTNYRRYSLLAKYMIAGQLEDLSHMLIGGGLICETLKFYIDGELDATSTRFEKFEGFDRQLVPVPAVYTDASFALNDSFGYGADMMIAWLPKSKTQYQEGGHMYILQQNADAKLKLSWKSQAFGVTTGYKYKYFYQKQTSGEDTNKFLLSSLGPFLDVALFF